MVTDKYVMTLIVPARLVGTILDVLKGEGLMVKTEPYVETEQQQQPKKKEFRYAGGKRNKGISGVDLAIQSIQAGVKTDRGLMKAFVIKGFSENSSGPVISRLLQEGRIGRNSDGSYSFIK